MPFYALAKRLGKSGCAVAGLYGAKQLSFSRELLVGDEDLFPPGSVRLKEVKVIREDGRKVASYAGSLAAAYRCGWTDLLMGYLTDTGYIPEETGRRLLGVELLVLESNHDENMLRSGPYPYALKRRVLGPQGHLSNAAAALYARDCAQAGARTILLAHLSRENNTPELALRTVGAPLSQAGWRGRLAAAPWNGPSELYALEAAACRG